MYSDPMVAPREQAQPSQPGKRRNWAMWSSDQSNNHCEGGESLEGPAMNDQPKGNPWVPYAPDDKMPWDLQRVVHLHRRAGFAASWSEIQRDLKDGPQASIDRLLNGKARENLPADFERVAGLLADAAVSAGDPARLKAWWVYRMLFGPDPLGERL